MSIVIRDSRAVQVILALLLCLAVATPALSADEASRWIYQSKPNRSPVAVVFVHGIFGDSMATWTNGSGGTFFKFLKENPEVGAKVDIFAFGFTSKAFGGGSMGISQAATRLDELLEFHDVWSYSQVVFVTHSMGGLVVMRSLAIRPHRRTKVPLLVFFATPQEGSQIAAIGDKLLSNRALRDLFPIDGNSFLQSLDEDWRQLGNDVPYIACAYETKAHPALGQLVVPYSSSTRMCKGNALAVGGADHVTIVKPNSPTDDSVVFLVNRLKERVFNAARPRSFLTPDFSESNGRLVFVLRDKESISPARLINNTAAPLTYLMSGFSDRQVYYWPRDTPKKIDANQQAVLEFAVPNGKAETYSFTLQVEGSESREVLIKIPSNAPAGRKPLRQSVAVGVLDYVNAAAAGASVDKLVAAAIGATRRHLIGFPPDDLSIVTAEVFLELNLPEFALATLESTSSNLDQAQELRSALAAQLSGTSVVDQNALRDTFTSFGGEAIFRQLAVGLKGIPALRGYGYAIEGDLAYAKGESVAARIAYAQAGSTLKSSLLDSKVASLNSLAVAKVAIGVAAPLSGPIAHLGRDNELGARLAIDGLNARGLILDGKVAEFQLVSVDDAGDAKQGVEVANSLIASKVSAVIGHLNSSTSIAASKIYSDAGIPQISPSATNPKYTRQGYKTTFRVAADNVRFGAVLGKFAVQDLKGKRIAVIDDRTAYGQGIADEFEKGIESVGGKSVARIFASDKATDFTAIFAALRAKNPDVIFFGGMDAVAGPMLLQMKSAGIRAKFMGGDGICSNELPMLARGAIADGQVVCAENTGVDTSAQRSMEAFRTTFKSKFDADVQEYAPYAYDSVNLVAAAMVRAGSADPAKYLPSLASTADYKGVTGLISFDEKGDLKNSGITLYTYTGGKRERFGTVR